MIIRTLLKVHSASLAGREAAGLGGKIPYFSHSTCSSIGPPGTMTWLGLDLGDGGAWGAGFQLRPRAFQRPGGGIPMGTRSTDPTALPRGEGPRLHISRIPAQITARDIKTHFRYWGQVRPPSPTPHLPPKALCSACLRLSRHFTDGLRPPPSYGRS